VPKSFDDSEIRSYQLLSDSNSIQRSHWIITNNGKERGKSKEFGNVN